MSDDIVEAWIVGVHPIPWQIRQELGPYQGKYGQVVIQENPGEKPYTISRNDFYKEFSWVTV